MAHTHTHTHTHTQKREHSELSQHGAASAEGMCDRASPSTILEDLLPGARASRREDDASVRHGDDAVLFEHTMIFRSAPPQQANEAGGRGGGGRTSRTAFENILAWNVANTFDGSWPYRHVGMPMLTCAVVSHDRSP
jgi:hypothetical protein